jgi:hypothetical protein
VGREKERQQDERERIEENFTTFTFCTHLQQTHRRRTGYCKATIRRQE